MYSRAASIKASKLPIALSINTGKLFHATSLTCRHVDSLILCSHVLHHASVTGTGILFLSQALGVRVSSREKVQGGKLYSVQTHKYS